MRGDVVFNATDNLSIRVNYQDNDSSFTEPRVQDAMFRTYDEMRIIVGMPEFYRLAGAEDFFNPLNQQAGYPGGRVGKWENRSNLTLPNRYATEQASLDINWSLTDSISLSFLTASTKQSSDSVVDWDNSQYDLVTDINRTKLDVFSQEIQLTGGGDRVEWLAGVYYWDQEQHNRNGRWQVMEFQLGQLNINSVYASPECNVPVPAIRTRAT